MSFRELRNFTEMMRALGYPRLISVDNFRTPNFELVADVLYWMVKRYDPGTSLSDVIDTEDDRVEFLTSIAQAMAVKAKVKLNAKRLYAADGRAVKELLKISTMLYDASRITGTNPADVDDIPSGASHLNNIKGARVLATDITERGARLFDLLGKEHSIREERARSLRFLDQVSGNLDNSAEYKYVEQAANEILSNLRENIESMKKQSTELEADEKNLDNKIRRKRAELERNEKRLKNLQSVRPTFMDEYERLEVDLQYHYEQYLERFRNLDYLEFELDLYNKTEKAKIEENDRALKRMQKRLREEELRILRGDVREKDVEDRAAKNPAHLNANPYRGPGNRRDMTGGHGRPNKQTTFEGSEMVRQHSGNQSVVHGSIDGGSEEDSESVEITDDDLSQDSDSAESEEVSVASNSGSATNSEMDDDDISGSEISNNSEASTGEPYNSDGEDSQDDF